MRMVSRDAPLRCFIASAANDRVPQRFSSLYPGDDVRMHNSLQLKYGMTGVKGQYKNHCNPFLEAAKRIRGVIACSLLLLIK